MRVRLVTNPPLPVLKAWFSLQSLPVSATILDFKNQLCSDIQILCGLKKHDITLFLDDFQLLDEGPIHTIRDGDLIFIKKAASSDQSSGYAETTSMSKKRKRAGSIPTQKPPPLPSFENQVKVSSSGSDSGSESTSDQTSSGSSSSDSTSSDSESDSPPPLVSSRLVQATAKLRSSTVFTPPGQGKPTTQNRNLRRRRKKQYERLTAEQTPDNQAAGVNAIPLGSIHAETEISSFSGMPPLVRANGSSDLTMTSLSNKNKRRGFKNAMGQNAPAKIVFSQETSVCEGAILSQMIPRLIPPSEKQEVGQLPANMFVTSVNVEEGSNSNNKQKKRPTPVNGGTPPVQCMQNDDERGLDLNAVGQKWDALERINKRLNLRAGTVVGWKALGINPATITPEVLLHTARVVRSEEECVLVYPLTPVSFDQDEIDEVSYLWDDIIGGQWKIIGMGL